MTEQRVCAVEDLRPGATLRIDHTLADGSERPIVIVRDERGEFFAVDDICTHGAVSLSEGEVAGREIECWGHGARFDFHTGEATALPAILAVATYPVRIEDGFVFVNVDAPASPMLPESPMKEKP